MTTKIKESLRISSILSDSPASKVKLASRFGFICNQISQLLRLVINFMAFCGSANQRSVVSIHLFITRSLVAIDFCYKSQ